MIEVEKIYVFFTNFRSVEPSDIVLLAEDKTIDESLALVVTREGIDDYKSFIEKREIDRMKSLYWD